METDAAGGAEYLAIAERSVGKPTHVEVVLFATGRPYIIENVDFSGMTLLALSSSCGCLKTLLLTSVRHRHELLIPERMAIDIGVRHRIACWLFIEEGYRFLIDAFSRGLVLNAPPLDQASTMMSRELDTVQSYLGCKSNGCNGDRNSSINTIGTL